MRIFGWVRGRGGHFPSLADSVFGVFAGGLEGPFFENSARISRLLTRLHPNDRSSGNHYIRLCTVDTTNWSEKTGVIHKAALRCKRREKETSKKKPKRGDPTEKMSEGFKRGNKYVE